MLTNCFVVTKLMLINPFFPSIRYEEHLESAVRVILLSEDVRNRDLATQSGLLTSSIEGYISTLSNGEPLLDKLSKKEAVVETSVKDSLYPLHATPSEIHAGIKNQSLLQGMNLYLL